MNQIGNLASICARRKDNILMQIFDGFITVYIGEGPDRKCIKASGTDDETLAKIIYELNFGQFKEKTAV